MIDYGFMGIGTILIFYYLRDRKTLKLVAAGAAIFALWFAQCMVYILQGAMSAGCAYCLHRAAEEAHGVLAFPLIWLYNGEKGRQLPKLFYYLFYPGHLAFILLVIYMVFIFIQPEFLPVCVLAVS